MQEKIKMTSVNQMVIYHTIVEVFNIIYNSFSEQIHKKYIHQDRNSLGENANNLIRVSEIPRLNLRGLRGSILQKVRALPPVDLHWFFEISIRTEKRNSVSTEKNFQL